MRDLGAVLDREEPALSGGRSGTIKCRRQGRETSPSAGGARRHGSTPYHVRARHGAALGLELTQRALHMNAIVSPIPTKVYKPATVTPRQTSAMTLWGWSLICLPGIALLLGCCPAHIDHAGGGELFRLQGTNAHRRRNGNFTKSRPRSTSGGTSKCLLCPQERTLLTTTGLDTLAPSKPRKPKR
jgi:hypothetical protein